jgi:hypothetical protein
MHDKPVIIVGLVVGVGLLTLPIWYGLAPGAADSPPVVKVPEGRCVEDLETMRAHHMELLNEWRNEVVREGKRFYVSKAYGTRYEMSLTNTCLKCHATPDELAAVRPASAALDGPRVGYVKFCHECHDYANVRPTCWQCHVEP